MESTALHSTLLSGGVSAPSTAMSPAGAATGGSATDFVTLLAEQMGQANQQFSTSQASVNQFLSGNLDNVHSVVLEATKAELSFRMLLEVRNRLSEQYQDIMRMQV